MTSIKTYMLALFFSSFAQADCFTLAGNTFGISPVLLKAIAIKESGLKPTAINLLNSNGSEDVCMMQINSSHFPQLTKFGITRQRLMSDPCICIATGAWILHGLFRQYGQSWETIGMYNAGTSSAKLKIRLRYAHEVAKIYRNLYHETAPATPASEQLAHSDTLDWLNSNIPD